MLRSYYLDLRLLEWNGPFFKWTDRMIQNQRLLMLPSNKFHVAWQSATHVATFTCFSKNISRKILSTLFAFSTNSLSKFGGLLMKHLPIKRIFLSIFITFLIFYSIFADLNNNIRWLKIPENLTFNKKATKYSLKRSSHPFAKVYVQNPAFIDYS